MNTRFEDIRSLFDAAMTVPAEQREALLEKCGYGPDIVEEVKKLIQALDDDPTQLLDRFPAYSDTFELTPGDRIGPYRIESLLGRGGMGAVYKASRVDSFEKQVAIKVVATGIGLDAFRRERQILAALEHPNIARLLDGGETVRVVPYLVMEYVDGKPLTHPDAIRGLSTQERLRRFLAVCEGVQYLHENSIIHRDLKPANILVSPAGAVKLLDFGISKFVRGREGGATTAPAGMTPKYASPEQILQKPIAPSSDVYSLGVMLFELLTNGTYPYPTTSNAPPHEFLEAALKAEPRRPSEANREIARDLDSIVLKALARDPADRYATAAELKDDVRRFMDGKPVRAHNGGRIYRAAKLLARNRNSVLAGTAAALVIAWLAGYAFFVSRNAANEAPTARRVSPDDEFDYRSGVISADGRYLAYVSSRTRWRQLWLQEMRGAVPSPAPPVPLTNANGHVSGPRFVPGGSRIAYFVLDDEGKGTIETISIPGPGTPSVMHVFDTPIVFPQISPDGKHAMYLEHTPGPAVDYQACVLRIAINSQCRLLPELERLRRLSSFNHLFWNGDSQSLLLRIIEKSSRFPTVWKIPLDGTPAQPTTLAADIASSGLEDIPPALVHGNHVLMNRLGNVWAARFDSKAVTLRGSVTRLFSGTETVLPSSMSDQGTVVFSSIKNWRHIEIAETEGSGNAKSLVPDDLQPWLPAARGTDATSVYFARAAFEKKESTVHALHLPTMTRSIAVSGLPSSWNLVVSHDRKRVAFNVYEDGRWSIRLGEFGADARASTVVCGNCGYATTFSPDSQSLWIISGSELVGLDLANLVRSTILRHTSAVFRATPFGGDGKWIAVRTAFGQPDAGKVYLYPARASHSNQRGFEIPIPPSDEILWESNGAPVFYYRNGSRFVSVRIDTATGRPLASREFQIRDSRGDLVASSLGSNGTISWEPVAGSIVVWIPKARHSIWTTTIPEPGKF